MTRAAAWAVRAAATLTALTLGPAVLAGCGASPAAARPDRRRRAHHPDAQPASRRLRRPRRQPVVPARSGHPMGLPPLHADRLPHTSWRPCSPTPRDGRGDRHHGRALAGRALRRAYDAPPRSAGTPRTRPGNVWWFGQQRAAARAARSTARDRRRGGPDATAPRPACWSPATPRVGDGYVNGVQPGVVERRSTVVSLDATVATTQRTFRHTVATRDLSTLEPLHSVQSFYARGRAWSRSRTPWPRPAAISSGADAPRLPTTAAPVCRTSARAD